MLQAFCWLCGGATGRAHTWSSIENHSCGRYKEEAEERVRDSCLTAITALLQKGSMPLVFGASVFWLGICFELPLCDAVWTVAGQGTAWPAQDRAGSVYVLEVILTWRLMLACCASQPSCGVLCMQANSALKCHKRYMHYFTHFQNHQDSHKKEKEQQ